MSRWSLPWVETAIGESEWSWTVSYQGPSLVVMKSADQLWSLVVLNAGSTTIVRLHDVCGELVARIVSDDVDEAFIAWCRQFSAQPGPTE